MNVNVTAWIEHHATQVVSLAGLLGGLVMMFPGFAGFADPAVMAVGAVISAVGAALHLANRALDAFAEKAGVARHAPMREIGPSH